MCARCERLEEEVAYLKSELGLQIDGGQIAATKIAFRVTEQKARILIVLYRARSRMVSNAQLLDSLPPRYGEDERSEKHVHSSISQLRRVVGMAAVETIYAQGYRLSDAMRARMDVVLQPVQAAA